MNFFYALDIGSKKMTLAAAEIPKGGPLGPILIETQASRGIFKGVVNDLAALTDSIEQLLRKMESKTHNKMSQIALSINGNYINAFDSHAAIVLSERGTRSITKRDVERLNGKARALGLELDEHLLAEYPQGYSIDRHNLTLNPLGLHGRKFEGDLLLVSAKSGYIDNMIKAVEQAGLDIVDVVFSGIAAAEAVLTREDKEKGAVVVDIGDCLTGILIFKDSVVRKLNVLTFGGKNLSEIISNYFKLPLELADEIKESSLELGVDFQDTEEVMIKTEYAYKPIKKKELAGIVQPEIDRFVVMLKDFISQSGVEGIAASRIVVTGGVSLLEGLLEKMERDLGMPVSLGLTKGHSNMPLSRAPAYACAIGLLHLQNDAYSARGHKLQGEGKNRLSKMVDYVVNLYQDYF